MNLWRVTLSTRSGYCSGGEKLGSFIDCIRDMHELPYIPATHVKGILRCEAERILRSTADSNVRSCSIFGEDFHSYAGSADGNPRLCPEVLRGTDNYGCDICRLFGLPNISNTEKTKGLSGYRDGKIRITDFHLQNPRVEDRSMEQRPHVAISRYSGTKETGHIFSRNMVPEKRTFRGYIIIRTDLMDSEKRLLMASLISMAHYGIGGNRSRGLGEVSIDIEPDCSIKEYHDDIDCRLTALQDIRNKEG